MKYVNNEYYLNQSETCALLGISPTTFRAIRKTAGDFPRGYILLKRPMWKMLDIKAWAKQRLAHTTQNQAA